jgi:hypothetical protein
MDRPVVVFSLREVRRDGNGKMDDLKEWSWWALEMIRRCLKDYWAGDAWGDGKSGNGKRGKGGEGCVILVDAAGAGYRNLVGHPHSLSPFPSKDMVYSAWYTLGSCLEGPVSEEEVDM